MATKTLRNLSERKLAAFQSAQVGNTCTFHAISVALRLLLDLVIDPMELSAEVDRLWRRGRLMRVYPGWAVTPRMQVRIARYLAKTHGLPIEAKYHRGDPETLPGILADPEVVPLVTLIWWRRQAPPIYFGTMAKNLHTSLKAGGHTMILAAYDPGHQAEDQFPTPWGFINPWQDHAKQLFWMRDEDFRKAWGFWLPFNGPNPLVVIRKTDWRVEFI